MIIQWVKNFFSMVNPGTLIQGAREADRRARLSLHDQTAGIPNTEETAAKGAELAGILQQGGAILEKKRLRRNVRRAVEAKIASAYNHPQIVDEVTERITEAALSDPFYKRLFNA